MPNEVKILLTAVDNASSTVQRVNKELRLTSGLGEFFKGALGGSASSLLGLAGGAAAAVAGLNLVRSQLQQSVSEFSAYISSVAALARTIGATPEEASKLLNAADDVGVSVATLQSALEAAIRKGVKPTIAGMAELADQYLAIQDPIERAAFLMENFGRAGNDLAPLMARGSAGIKALGDEAARAGLVIGSESIATNRAYKESVDALGDAVLSLRGNIATALMPAITDLNNQMAEYILYLQTARSASASPTGYLGISATPETPQFGAMGDRAAEQAARLAEMTQATKQAADATGNLGVELRGVQAVMTRLPDVTNAQSASLSRFQAAQEAAAAAAARMESAQRVLTAGLSGSLGQAWGNYEDTMARLAAEQTTLTATMTKYVKWGLEPTNPKMVELTAALKQNKEAQSQARSEIEKTTLAFIFEKLAAQMTADQALILAETLGLITPEDAAVTQVIEDVTTAAGDFAKTPEGAQMLQTFILTAAGAMERLKAAGQPASLQSLKDFMVGKPAVSPDEWAGFLDILAKKGKPAGDAASDTADGLGEIDAKGRPAAAVLKDVVTFQDQLQSKTVTYTIITKFVTEGSAPGGGGGGGGGGNGGGGDYPVNPGPGSPPTPYSSPGAPIAGTMVVNQFFYNTAAAALGMAFVASARRARLNLSMGMGR